MPCQVIAECGVNFSSLDEARQMIVAAQKAGVYGVKFQYYNDETIKDSSRKDFLKKIMLTEDNIAELQKYAQARKLAFGLTPMFLEGVDVAAKYADFIKIRFKDNENQPLIDKALEMAKILLISVPRPPIDLTLRINPRVYPLYCLPRYPPEPEDFELDGACACKGVSSHYPHTLFDMAFAINRLYIDAFIEKHVMLSEGHISGPRLATYEPTFKVEPLYKPIDYAVSITFDELNNFVKQLQLLERLHRTRIS